MKEKDRRETQKYPTGRKNEKGRWEAPNKGSLLSDAGFPGGASGKESTCQSRRCRRYESDLWVGKISWGRKWQPTAVIWPGKLHGQRSLAGPQSMGSQRVGHDWVHTYTQAGENQRSRQFPQAVSLTSPHLFRHKMIRYEQGMQTCTTLLTSEHGSEEMMKSSMLSSSK